MFAIFSGCVLNECKEQYHLPSASFGMCRFLTRHAYFNFYSSSRPLIPPLYFSSRRLLPRSLSPFLPLHHPATPSSPLPSIPCTSRTMSARLIPSCRSLPLMQPPSSAPVRMYLPHIAVPIQISHAPCTSPTCRCSIFSTLRNPLVPVRARSRCPLPS